MSDRQAPAPPRNAASGLPLSIWALGFGSLFMDTSSELIHSLLPVFMVSVLGAGMLEIGLIEGVAEATASIVKVFSGALSDRVGRRKLLMVCGYGLGAASKPVFPLAPTVEWVFAARFVDRIGKGIRGAPRDALVADLTPPEQRGAAYGLRQSLDSVGAFGGPLLAVLLMRWCANDIRAVLWFAALPALVAVVLLVVAVREPAASERTRRAPLVLADVRRLPPRYRSIVALGAVFTLARFSEAFLVLRAQSVGLSVGAVPLVLVVMNVAYAASAYPVGVAADRLSARALLVVGLLVLIGADLVLAAAARPGSVLFGSALWGLHMGLSQGLFAMLVAETSPAELRGTGFGIFNLVSGIALLLASLIAGALWTAVGAPATFVAGAGFAVVAAAGLLIARPQPRAR